MFIQIIVIAIGGSLGTLLRYFLAVWVSGLTRHVDFPWGIFLCNVLGSFLVGIFAGVILHKTHSNPLLGLFLIVGFCGGFTTFSTFSLDTIHFLKGGNMGLAFLNVSASLLCCLTVTYLGLKWGALLYARP